MKSRAARRSLTCSKKNRTLFEIVVSSLVLLALPMAPLSAIAQDDDESSDEERAIEEVIVTVGPRATLQKSIELKRDSVQIVDGLNAEEIGEIPALSIGEALETLTGVASHRENGGATEASIRGLGPFLTSTVFNGRLATSGNGTRGVNFSIFPSELFNKIGVHKTQSASHIEGAVGGQIQLETRSPIEFGKRRFQFALKGAHNELQENVRGADDFGFRATASFIDSFETEDNGTFGYSLGVQIREESDPEQEFNRSNTPRICALNNGIPTSQVCTDDQGTGSDLIDVNGTDTTADDVQALRNPGAPSRDFAFLSSSANFRQNQADDERAAVFGALQWQPNDKLDLNFDFQWSERIQQERRSDLLFAELNRNLNAADSVDVSGGFLQSFENALQEIQLIGQDFTRDEEYMGFGLKAKYLVHDDLEVSFDVAYSDTLRVENEESFRLGDNEELLVSADFSRSDVGVFRVLTPGTLTPFDASDLGEFLNGAEPNGVGTTPDQVRGLEGDRFRARVQEDIRENTLLALRGDFEWNTTDFGIVSSIEGGIRLAEMEYSRKGNINSDIEFDDTNGLPQADVLAAIANNCIGAPIDSDFTEVSASQNAQFLNYNAIDAGCSLGLIRSALDSNLVTFGGDEDARLTSSSLTPNNTFNGSSVDLEESTYAAYLKFNFDSELFGLPARGDFGLRVVHTSVESRSFRAPFLLDVDLDVAEGNSFELDSPTNFASPAVADALGGNTFLNVETDTHSYTNFLPSASLVLDLQDDLLFRAAIFRGISRSDPAILGRRQQLGTIQADFVDPGGNITVQDLTNFITTQGRSGGSAALDPFTSWNIDTAIEWYPDADTIVAAGIYYKRFKGGYQNTFVNETFTIIDDRSDDTQQALADSSLFAENGSIEVTAPISTIETTNNDSNLLGLELSLAHSLTYLDGFLSGFGGKLGYNYAESDFEFEDDFAGAGVGLDADGNPVPLVGLVPPAEIFGLSRHVVSSQIFWQNDVFDAAVLFKFRSQYFQQFVDDPGRIRFTDDNGVLEFRAKYRATPNIQITFEALNITDEPRVDFRGLDGNVVNVLSFGPRFFLGIRGKWQ